LKGGGYDAKSCTGRRDVGVGEQFFELPRSSSPEICSYIRFGMSQGRASGMLARSSSFFIIFQDEAD
jgi:hypothetical protein